MKLLKTIRLIVLCVLCALLWPTTPALAQQPNYGVPVYWGPLPLWITNANATSLNITNLSLILTNQAIQLKPNQGFSAFYNFGCTNLNGGTNGTMGLTWLVSPDSNLWFSANSLALTNTCNGITNVTGWTNFMKNANGLGNTVYVKPYQWINNATNIMYPSNLVTFTFDAPDR